ncbi:MAG: NADPH:quinone oxidoreductase family protein [Proteobacteria bacterium]|nr:NADPH:quinone oxidoreductase family protein [Pseudomonadota bacterium]
MRAVRIHELTGPSALRVDTDVPDPTPGPSDIVIEVRAAGVNFPDVLQTYGKYQFKPTPPFSPGGEVSGVVSAVGARVTRFTVGERVAATALSGGFAEQLAVPEAAAVKLPETVSFEVGAATLLTYATTYHALVDRAALAKGETLLVLGAAGGVGIAAVELGRVLGARVIAAASSPEKLALTGGNGVDIVYDPVGGALAETALRGIAWQGRYLVVGFASGDIPKIPLNLVLLKGCQVVGVFWGAFAMREPARNREHAEQIFRWVADGSLNPHVDLVLPFDQAADALQRLERRQVKGKVVLVP